MTVSKKRATYADLMKVPDFKVAEILDGELFTSPRPASPHARAASVLGSELMGAFDRPPGGGPVPGGWWLLDEPELHLGDDVLVPDIAGWRRERMPLLPRVAAFTQAPDWLCEVVSPSTVAIDRGRKMRIYARENVGHLWIVDPIAKTVEVYRLESRGWLLVATVIGDRLRAEPFEQLEIDLSRLWLPLPLPATTPSGESSNG